MTFHAKKHLKSNKMIVLLEYQRFLGLTAPHTSNTKVKIFVKITWYEFN